MPLACSSVAASYAKSHGARPHGRKNRTARGAGAASRAHKCACRDTPTHLVCLDDLDHLAHGEQLEGAEDLLGAAAPWRAPWLPGLEELRRPHARQDHLQGLGAARGTQHQQQQVVDWHWGGGGKLECGRVSSAGAEECLPHPHATSTPCQRGQRTSLGPTPPRTMLVGLLPAMDSRLAMSFSATSSVAPGSSCTVQPPAAST